jgi:two-component system nitrate/nitrite sensor histidine kinase NarX
MFRLSNLTAKLVSVGSVILVLSLVWIGLTLWVTWQLEGGAAAVNEAGRMRMQTWRLASAVQAEQAQAEVQGLVKQFDDSLALLRSGDPARPLFIPLDDAVQRRLGQVEALWADQRRLWNGPQRPDEQAVRRAAGDFVGAIDALVLDIERYLSRLTAILTLFQFLMMALAIGAAVVMIFVGYQYIINPLGQLQARLRQLESGDFATRIPVESHDEFGQVAAGFNRMAATLQSLYEGLEAQVAAKTQRVEAQRARLEALYEVSAFLASAHSVDELSHGFSQRVRKVTRADAVAVRWVDEADQRYLMLANDCFPADMVQAEQSLKAHACACGDLAPDARTRVIPIQSLDVPHERHCARVGYQSLISVPVRLQQRLMGEITLFYNTSVALSPEEAELLDALASHLASALEGLRAEALEREAAVGEERAMLARELHDSIAQSLSFLKIQVQLLRSARERGQAQQMDTALNELDAGLRESINDVRELLVHFRTRTNTDDVEQALQETLQKFEHQTGLATELQVLGQGLPLPADVQVQVLHVVQEALSNVRKHAHASRVSLTVQKGAHWQIVVRDDGCGFDLANPPGGSHVGIHIMKERAARIGARVRMESSPGQGSTVTLVLPAHPVSAPSTEVAPAPARDGALT